MKSGVPLALNRRTNLNHAPADYSSNHAKVTKPEGTAANPDKSEIPNKVRRGPEERRVCEGV